MKHSIKLIVGVLAMTFSLSFGATAYAEDIVKDVPVTSTFKTYEDYRGLTKRNSPQHALQSQATTDPNGLRVVNNRYLVAVGSYFTDDIGTPIDVTLDNGSVIPCIVGDAKADRHTKANHSVGVNNNDAVEFIVDTKHLNTTAKARGDISYIPGFAGAVESITIVDESLEDIIQPTETVTICPDESQVISVAQVTDYETQTLEINSEVETPTVDETDTNTVSDILTSINSPFISID